MKSFFYIACVLLITSCDILYIPMEPGGDGGGNSPTPTPTPSPAPTQPAKPTAPAPGPSGMAKLGEQLLNLSVDHENITVSGAQGAVSSLQLMAQRAPIEINKCTITYSDGSTQNVDIRQNLNPGSASQVITLSGGNKLISFITIWYNMNSREKRKVLLEVYGKK